MTSNSGEMQSKWRPARLDEWCAKNEPKLTSQPRYDRADDAIGYAKFYSRAQDCEIHVFNEPGEMIETHQHAGEFREW